MKTVRAEAVVLVLSLAAFVILLSPSAPANKAHAGAAFVMPTPYMVKDINANNESSSPECEIAMANFMLCTVVDGVHGREPWRSDGTAEGSYLLKDINPGEDGSDAYGFVAANDGMTVFFSTDDGTHGNELWKTDGTPDGTVMVRDILAGSGRSYPDDLTAVGDRLYFSVYADVEDDRELWVTDGTRKGTKQVLEINPDGSDQVSSLEVMGGILYFTANDGQHGVELWRSDGTEAGTYMVKDTNPIDDDNYRLNSLTAVGDKLFFVLTLDESDGGIARDLWVSDGTAAGTKLTKKINPGSGGSHPRTLAAYDDKLYFEAFDGTDYGLWRSDGTKAGTELVKPVNIANLVVANELLFFRGKSNSLWRSDGTAEGTYTIKKFSSESCWAEVYPAGDRIYAKGGDEHGCELWTSDGTKKGTYLVKDIYSGAESSSPGPTLVYNGRAYFSAYRPPERRELWITDGTDTGTMLAVDFNVKGYGSDPSPIGPLIDSGSQVFLRARDTFAGNEPMLTDGTEAGTYVLKDVRKGSSDSGPGYHWPDPVVLANDQIFFIASTDNRGQEMWTSDGTTKGTEQLLDICPGSMDANIGHLAATENAAFFTSDVPTNGGCSTTKRLWKSEGPAGGAVPIADGDEFAALAASSDYLFYVKVSYDDYYSSYDLWAVDEHDSAPRLIADHVGSNLAVVNDDLFFFSNGRLWKTDGTAAGTVRIKESNYIDEMFPLDDSLYYLQLAENGSWETFDLWVSDGTKAGTRLVRGGWPSYPSPGDFVQAGDVVYFTAASVEGQIRALWRTDGTPEGTTKIRGFVTECEYGPRDLAAVGDMLFFRGCDEAHGYELWTSDGTKAGTKMVYEINPLKYEDGYPKDGYPYNLAAFGSKLYFAANDGQHGTELWALDLALVAGFEASPLQGVPPLEVAFNNLSTGDFDTCVWDFGDGKTKTTCGDPVHRYRQEGRYTVSLTVSGAGGEKTMAREAYIVVEKQRAFLPSVVRP